MPDAELHLHHKITICAFSVNAITLLNSNKFTASVMLSEPFIETNEQMNNIF